MFHDDLHGGPLGCRVGTQAPHIRGLAFGMGQDQGAGQPLDALKRERALPFDFLPPPRPPRRHRVVAGFGPRQPALGAGDAPGDFVSPTSDLPVDALQDLGQGYLDVRGNALDLGQLLGTHLVQKGQERVFVEPGVRLGKAGRGRQQVRGRGRTQVPDHVRFAQAGRGTVRQFHGEQPLVDDTAEPVHDARPVEVEPGGGGVLQGVEAGAGGTGVPAPGAAVAPECLEQRMAGCDPFEMEAVRGVAVRGQARIACRQRRERPVGFVRIAVQARGDASRVEGVRQAGGPHGFADEARDGLGHDPAFLGAGAAFDQHVEIELFRGQPFQRRPTEVSKAGFVDVLEEPVFQVGVAQFALVVIAEHALDLGRRQNLAHDVEYRVVVQGVADFLELVEQALQHIAFDRVGRHEIEDQAVVALAVAVDAAHALFEPIRVPGNVVVEQDVAALQVDALAGRLGGDQHLDGAVAELLFSEEARPRFVARARLHAAVDAAYPEAPRLGPLDQIFERVLELGEDQQPLVGAVEETLLPHDVLEPAEFRLVSRAFDGPGTVGEDAEFGHLGADLLRVAGQRHRFQDGFQPRALGVFHFFQVVPVGEGGRRRLGAGLGMREAVLQAFGAIVERAAHGVRAGGEPALVQRHEEADRPGPPVVAVRRGAAALPFHEAGDLLVQVQFGPGDGEVHGTRNALREDGPRPPASVGVAFGEIDHRFFGPPQIEGGAPPVHGRPDGLHVGVRVAVQQLQEQAEVVRVALVRRRGQE